MFEMAKRKKIRMLFDVTFKPGEPLQMCERTYFYYVILSYGICYHSYCQMTAKFQLETGTASQLIISLFKLLETKTEKKLSKYEKQGFLYFLNLWSVFESNLCFYPADVVARNFFSMTTDILMRLFKFDT